LKQVGQSPIYDWFSARLPLQHNSAKVMSKVDHVHGSLGLVVAIKLEEPLRLTSNHIFLEFGARQANLAIFVQFQMLSNIKWVLLPSQQAFPVLLST
jgi:hypothetical protein